MLHRQQQPHRNKKRSNNRDKKEKSKKYGKKYSYFNVSFGDMAILNGEGKNKDIVIEKNKLHFLKNYYLPVTFTKITNIPFKYVEVKRNKTQIKTLIDNDLHII